MDLIRPFICRSMDWSLSNKEIWVSSLRYPTFLAIIIWVSASKLILVPNPENDKNPYQTGGRILLLYWNLLIQLHAGADHKVLFSQTKALYLLIRIRPWHSRRQFAKLRIHESFALSFPCVWLIAIVIAIVIVIASIYSFFFDFLLLPPYWYP